MTDNPHFALPFVLGSQGALVNEQDTINDIVACVTAIVSTPIGFRAEAPTFGVPDLVFRRQPLGASDLIDVIGPQEPRAVMVIEENPSMADALVDQFSIGVSLYGKGVI